jgi:hypothetical protein
MTKFKPAFVRDPQYQDPGNGQPLYPSLSDYPNRTKFGAGGSSNKFAPVVGKTPKAKAPKKVRVPKPAKAHAVAKPAKQQKATAGGHVATRTAKGGSSRAAGRGFALGLDVPYQLVEVEAASGAVYQEIVLSHTSGAGFGFGGAQLAPVGHHPQATGLARVGSGTGHLGVSRRAVILGYNSGTGIASVRDADAPDAPPYGVAVSPAVAGAMGSATEAGLSLWDTGDPNDLLVSTVL